MKLISMTDFILQTKNDFVYSENAKYEDSFKQIVNYAEFLKQPLTLGMFVPCDENGNIIEEMPYYADGIDKIEEYKKAREKVLFKDCEVKEIKSKPNYFVAYHKSQQIWISWTDRVVEDMILNRTYLNGLELTESAIKQIGLNP